MVPLSGVHFAAPCGLLELAAVHHARALAEDEFADSRFLLGATLACRRRRRRRHSPTSTLASTFILIWFSFQVLSSYIQYRQSICYNIHQ